MSSWRKRIRFDIFCWVLSGRNMAQHSRNRLNIIQKIGNRRKQRLKYVSNSFQNSKYQGIINDHGYSDKFEDILNAPLQLYSKSWCYSLSLIAKTTYLSLGGCLKKRKLSTWSTSIKLYRSWKVVGSSGDLKVA